MVTKVCEACGKPISFEGGVEICYHCLAGQTLNFFENAVLPPQSKDPSQTGGFNSVDDYEVLEEIGRGGMGVVYRANKISTKQAVALKFLHRGPDSSFRAEARFMTEIEAAAQLSHPNIVPIFDVGRHDDMPFYTMKVIEGGHLGDGDARRFDLEGVRNSVACLVKVAEAVHFAHEHGIIHRDLKPSNVLLDKTGEPYVSDFGLAKRMDDHSDLTLSGEVLGTPSYMAPEQASGSRAQQTIAVDVYSLGAVLYHAITGKAPFAAESALETLKQIDSQAVIPPSQIQSTIERDLETIVLKCLEKEAVRRYSSALALADDLRRWLAGRPVEARRTPWWERVRMWSRRQPYVASAASLALLLAGLLGLQTWTGIQRSQQEQVRIQQLSQRLGQNLTSGRLRLADELLKSGQRGEAVAHVAAIVRDRTSENSPFPYLIGLVEAQQFAWRMVPPLVHSNTVWQADFHPDGDRIVTANEDGIGRLWSLASPESPVHTLPHEAVVYRVDFNKTGSQVVTGSYDHTAQVWDVETGQPISPKLRLPGPVQNARFIGEDDQYLLVSGGAAVRVWNTSAFDEPHSELVVPPSESLIHIASTVPPAGERLLLGSVTGGLWLWDWEKGEVVKQGHSGAGYISDCVVSPEGDRFIALGNVDRLALWDTETLTPVTRLKLSEKPRSVGFSADRGIFVTATRDGYDFWETETGNPLTERTVLSTMLKKSADINRMPASEQFNLWFPFNYRSVFAFKPSGLPAATPAISFPHGVRRVTPDPRRRRLAVHTSDNRLHIWGYPESPNRNLIYRTPDPFVANRARFVFGNPGEIMLALGAIGSAAIKVVGLSDEGGPRSMVEIKRKQRLRGFWGDPSSRLLMTRDLDGTSRALIYSPERQTFEQIIDGSKGKLWIVSRDDQWGVGSAFGTQSLSLVSLTDPEHVRPLKNSKDLTNVVFSGDSRSVIGVTARGLGGVWDVASANLVDEFPIASRKVDTLACTSDASQLTVSYGGGILASWQMFPRKALIWEHFIEDGIRSIIYSPDDRWIAVGTEGGRVVTLEAETGRPLPNPIRRQARIETLHFTPDSRFLMIGSSDQTLGFWDPVSGFAVTEFVPFSGEPLSVDLSPDGRWYCFGSDGNTIEVRRVPEPVSVPDVPEWLVPFAEAVAGLRLGVNDVVEVIPWEARMATMASVRAMDPNAPLVSWARSVLSRGDTSGAKGQDSED